MIALRFLFNAVMTELIEGQKPKHGCAPVLLRGGGFKRVDWAGFIDLEDARKTAGALPVKLDIRFYSVAPGEWPKWIEIPRDKAVQGCLVRGGTYGKLVYAVVEDGRPRFVDR